MEEARYSINIRFSVKGFDSQLTVRGDVKDDIGSDFAAAVEFWPAFFLGRLNKVAQFLKRTHIFGQLLQESIGFFF